MDLYHDISVDSYRLCISKHSVLCCLCSEGTGVGVNRTGRRIISGPLPRRTRLEIVRLAGLGMQKEAISRLLDIPHVYINRIIKRCVERVDPVLPSAQFTWFTRSRAQSK